MKQKGAKQRVRLSEVAKASGVHFSTVSRVLRPGATGRVSPEVAERIKKVAVDLGYRPNSLAASLRTKSTKSLGLIVHDMGDPIYPPILNGIEAIVASQGFAVMVGNTGYSLDTEFKLLDRMASQMVDGIFLATTRLNDPVLERCNQYGIPVVSVLRQPETKTSPAVINDCRGGMLVIVRKVIASGHHDIAHIAAPQTLSTAVERLDGFHAAMDEAGLQLPAHRLEFVDQMTAEDGYLAAVRLLEAVPKKPSVIVCVNDLVAIGALRACREAGMKIPLDISITGYNDIPLLDMIDPPLTTVRMDLDEIGRNAGRMMIEQVLHEENEPPAIQIVRIGSQMLTRSSLADLNTQ